MDFDYNQTAIYNAGQDFECGTVSFLNGVATSNNYNQMVTLICSRYLIYVMILFAVFVAANWSSFQRLISSVFVGMGGKFAINTFVHRLRPYMVMDNVKTLDSADMGLLDSFGSSMPSGHTIVAFAIAASLAMEANKMIKQQKGISASSKFRTMMTPLAATTAASLVAVSRVAHGFHYPSDIGVGILVGVTGAFIGHSLF